MIELSEQMMQIMRKFKASTGNSIPLRELPAYVTNEQLIYASEKCIEQGEDRLFEILGVQTSTDKNVVY